MNVRKLVGTFRMNHWFRAAFLALAIICSPAVLAQSSSEDKYALNFINAEIDAVVRAVGSFTNRTFVVDPRVRGTISLISPEPLSRDEALNALLSALRLQGFTIVNSGGISRVVPENDAKVQASQADPTTALKRPDNSIVTQVFELKYESASAMVPILRPLVPPNNTLSAYPNNNSLVITDYADNLKRIAQIIAAMDRPAPSEVKIIPVNYALAIDLVGTVSSLLDESARGAGGPADAGQRITIMADQRTNSLLIRTASRARLKLARRLINQLDKPTKQAGNVWVVQLKNAEATQLAATLQNILSNQPKASKPAGASRTRSRASNRPNAGSSSSSGGGQLSGATGSFDLSSNGIIQADPSTNSLIVTAPEPIYRNLRAIIEKLDVRRAQVFVESLIVEVSTDKATEFGIQFQDLTGLTEGGVRAIGGTNFSSGGNNIIGAAQNLGSIGKGFNIGVVNGTINLPGVGEITNLGFLAKALESKADANILSTPNILTLDNEEAKIVIGQNVPFITGQFTDAGSSNGAVNPFQTIERQDVGLTLQVKPQVSEGDIVKLGIYQEVSSVVDSSNSAGVITNKRSIESNVLVESGNIIVLGGLVEDRVTGSADKVPFLGDIPGVGALFRYDTRRRVKTNLMVFLRPVVIRDEGLTKDIVNNRYDFIRGVQLNSQPTDNAAWSADAQNPLLPTRAAPPAELPRQNSLFIEQRIEAQTPPRFRSLTEQPPATASQSLRPIPEKRRINIQRSVEPRAIPQKKRLKVETQLPRPIPQKRLVIPSPSAALRPIPQKGPAFSSETAPPLVTNSRRTGKSQYLELSLEPYEQAGGL